ncbi:hypothetical protein J2S13_000053 [Oikeobacillus pervagus]|uniref:YpoC-like domain-containing protein n=1 Tax=Oikeobacillus pervagus TaxID=1325931 RepID=A0AAJ1SW17_9BACI|nr:hypothetical protein [Oikeobacillus pervagus]MDQ0213659.1 hypothetical protein [Oikeobacillus pervagus]
MIERKWVPDELFHPFFFPTRSVEVDFHQTIQEYPYFIYELKLKDGQLATYPWDDLEPMIPKILSFWEENSQKLSEKFALRNKEVKQEMQTAIAFYFMFLFWSNGFPVQLKDWDHLVNGLTIKPVNVVERLRFILNRPFSFHAYRQIQELWQEQHKQYAKNLSVRKNKGQRI